MSLAGSVRNPSTPVYVLAASLSALTAYAFYPGYLTWDSAYQWYQVRTGAWDNVHPVAMTLLWSATDRVLPGPGGYFLLQLAAYWAGIAALATGLFHTQAARAGVVIGLGLFPPVFALVPHLWKDVGLLVAVIWTIALLVSDAREPRRALRIAALATLSMACAYRHNAVPLAIPLIWYISGREWPGHSLRSRAVRTAALCLLVATVATVPNRLPGVAHRQVWPVTALWDIAAVSIAEDRILLPAQWIDPGLAMADLTDHFTPYANVPIFGSGKIRDSVSGPVTPAQSSALNRAWLDLWRYHFRAYAAHRLRLSQLLFGFAPDRVPDNLMVLPGITALADNPHIEPRAPALQQRWNSWIAARVNGPLFAFWLYVALAIAIAAAALRRGAHPLLWPVLVSAALYVAPLPLVAPSAEWRYLVWPVFATPLALLLLLASTAGRTIDRPAPIISRGN